MKIKMRPIQSVKDWAAAHEVDVHLAMLYQKLRSNWMRSVRRFKQKYGSIESGDIPPDVRMYGGKGSDLEDFLESRIMTMESRNRHATQYLFNRQQQYLENIGKYLWENDDFPIDDFLEKISATTPRERAQVIQEIGFDFFEQVYPPHGVGSAREQDEIAEDCDVAAAKATETLSRWIYS